jgi:hypothetical protein
MMSHQTMTVSTDDGDWLANFDYDFDGPTEATWFYCGQPFQYEPPADVRRELEEKAWQRFHGRHQQDPDEQGTDAWNDQQ